MRVKTSFIAVVAFIILLLPQTAFAHLVGQPPFFKINGKYAGFYPVPVSSTSLDIPQDMAPENYVVEKQIDFEIDPGPIQIPQDIVAKSAFSWDFGDGSKGSGLKASHTYAKPGPYILNINVSYSEVPEPSLLESVMLNVLPDENYQLPKAQIKVNGKVAKDPLVDIFNFGFNQEIKLEAQTEGSNSNLQYFWDFGDDKTSNKQAETHKYPNNPERTQYFPILRVKDDKGFYNDSYVQISLGAKSNSNSNSPGTKNSFDLKYAVVPVILAVIVIGFLAIRKKKVSSI